ncbi:hypothetical protein SAMN06295933_0914 [Desulfovibrio gilichinskyi]|uniref:Uncharacterized protein n=1 Tax=Desulfovibrio gilichinskyi TaxID=1519643 RepID=A0A1X7CHI9_9BACT|nr:hypothetical protein SAMN06295933_0914 [Desulfovibrio gilichinskyi]
MANKKFCPILGEDINEDGEKPDSCDHENCKFNVYINNIGRICVLFRSYVLDKRMKSQIDGIEHKLR